MSDRPGVYLALVHHPIRDRAGGTITTSVTNLDVHDIARSARTYGLSGYFIVTPIEAQRALVRHIMSYWREGGGAKRVPERAQALSIVREVPSFADAVAAVEAAEGARPVTVTTDARSAGDPRSFDEVREMVRGRTKPVLLVFGTGYGLAAEVFDATDVRLAPVRPGGYNHLAVRAAVSIILDRLLGDAGA